MRIMDRLRSSLPAALLLAGCVAAVAAPAPTPRGFSEKYLPEDTDFVLVVNVKQLAASPLYTRHFRQKIDDLLQKDPVPQWVRDLGTTLPKEVERVTIVMGRSSHPTGEDASRAGPTIMVEGRLDALHEAAKRLNKEHPDHVKEVKIGDANGYEIVGGGPEGFVVQPEANTLVYSPRREAVVEAVDKAAGKNKTRVKSKALRDLLGSFKPDAAIQFAATKDMVVGTESRSTINMGVRTTEVKVHTLADQGIESLVGHLTAGDDLKGRATLTAKDEATAKQLGDKITQGLDEAKANLKRFAGAQPQLASALKALEALKVSSSERAVIFEGTFDAAAVEGLVMSPFMIFAGRGPAAPAGAKPVPVPKKEP
jgi:hypothetical protein